MMSRNHITVFCRRREIAPVDVATHELLTNLLETPTSDQRLRVIRLQSLAVQRQLTLMRYPQMTWIDRVLRGGEYSLGSLVLIFVVWWLIDGYGRDWWHTYFQEPATPVAQVSPSTGFTSRSVLPSYTEVTVPLPFVADPPLQPQVVIDYLTPSRVYVPALQSSTTKPEPTSAPAAAVDHRPSRLTIDRIGVDSDVIEVGIQDGTWQVAEYAVGYHRGTGIAGKGNMVMAGHKGIRGAVFRNLEQLMPGDDVTVAAGGQRYTYRVRTTFKVWPDQVEVLYPTEKPQLTLITCTTWDTQRFVAVADLIRTDP